MARRVKARAARARETSDVRPVNPRAKGLVKATHRFQPAQLEALQVEAFRRAQERGSLKPDASEIVREAVEAWLAKKR